MEYGILQPTEALSAAISDYKRDTKMNYDELAKHWGVCKTTLYRAATGNWKRKTTKLDKIAKHVGIDLTTQIDAKQCLPVLAAIQQIWDGTDVHAQKLARLVIDIHELSVRHKS